MIMWRIMNVLMHYYVLFQLTTNTKVERWINPYCFKREFWNFSIMILEKLGIENTKVVFSAQAESGWDGLPNFTILHMGTKRRFLVNISDSAGWWCDPENISMWLVCWGWVFAEGPLPAPHTASSSWQAHSSGICSSGAWSHCSSHMGQRLWPGRSGHTSQQVDTASAVDRRRSQWRYTLTGGSHPFLTYSGCRYCAARMWHMHRLLPPHLETDSTLQDNHGNLPQFTTPASGKS